MLLYFSYSFLKTLTIYSQGFVSTKLILNCHFKRFWCFEGFLLPFSIKNLSFNFMSQFTHFLWRDFEFLTTIFWLKLFKVPLAWNCITWSLYKFHNNILYHIGQYPQHMLHAIFNSQFYVILRLNLLSLCYAGIRREVVKNIFDSFVAASRSQISRWNRV